MSSRKKVRIGDLLVENKIISEGQLGTALTEQKKTGRRLGRTLIELGYIDEDRLLMFLSQQLNIPNIDLRTYKFNPDTVRLLPETHARRYRAIVLDDKPDALLVGMADPGDIFGFDELTRILKRPITQAVVRESDLLRTIDVVYRRTAEITTLAEELGQELSEHDFDLAQLVQTRRHRRTGVQTVADAVQGRRAGRRLGHSYRTG